MDWPHLLRELSLSRTTDQFVSAVERLAGELGSQEPRFYLYDLQSGSLSRGPEKLAVDNATPAGSAALYCERVATPEGEALPVTRFGSLVGVLMVRKAGAQLEELASAAGMMLETSRRREQSRRCREVFQNVLMGVMDRAAPGGAGHVARVARIATELATLMDLSVQSRRELYDAAHFHDVGWLSDPSQERHAALGAQILSRNPALRPLARLVETHHMRYPGPSDVAVESWVLALAEELDEFFSQRRHLPLPHRTAEFYAEKAPHHHPEVVDALSGMIDSGRLAQIYA